MAHKEPAPGSGGPGSQRAGGRCLIFDSYYDPYRGVVAYFRVVSGRVLKGEKIRFMNTARRHAPPTHPPPAAAASLGPARARGRPGKEKGSDMM